MSSQLLDSPVESVRAAEPDAATPDAEGGSRFERVVALEGEVAAVAGVLNTAHARLVRLMRRALAGDLWGGEGFRTPEHWLCVRAGVSDSTARRIVALARRSENLPVLSETFEAGRLSLDQAAAVAAKTPPQHEESVTEFATRATVSQIRRALGRYPFTTDPDEERDRAARSATRRGDPPRLRFGTTDTGRRWLRFDATPETVAVIEAAVREAKDALFAAGDTDATLADGLVEVAARSLAAAPAPRRETYRVLLHLDLDDAQSWVDRGEHVAPDVVRRFTCDGTVQPVWASGGVPVSVGRAQRTVPVRTRRLVMDRDRGCRYPGCAVGGGFVEAHHVIHWADGGPTDLANLAALCPRHHSEHHNGVFTLTGDPTTPAGLTFADRHGRPITATPPRRWDHDPPPPEDLPGAGAYRPPTGERCDMNWVYFEPDPAATVAG